MLALGRRDKDRDKVRDRLRFTDIRDSVRNRDRFRYRDKIKC